MADSTYMYGLAAEFEDSKSLLSAAREVRAAGYTEVRAFTPYHIEGLSEVLDEKPYLVPYFVVAALFIGAFLAFALQSYTSVTSYPFNVGGRPLNSIPSFMLITFEFAVLLAALASVGGLFLRTGLPLPYHPVFNANNIEEASRSRFFLVVETTDRKFHLTDTRTLLEGLEPVEVSEVEG